LSVKKKRVWFLVTILIRCTFDTAHIWPFGFTWFWAFTNLPFLLYMSYDPPNSSLPFRPVALCPFHLLLRKSSCAKTAENKSIHWKNIAKILLYWIHESCNYQELSEKIEIPQSTLEKLLKWIVLMVILNFYKFFTKQTRSFTKKYLVFLNFNSSYNIGEEKGINDYIATVW
jgi:hypothetical protein